MATVTRKTKPEIVPEYLPARGLLTVGHVWVPRLGRAGGAGAQRGAEIWGHSWVLQEQKGRSRSAGKCPHPRALHHAVPPGGGARSPQLLLGTGTGQQHRGERAGSIPGAFDILLSGTLVMSLITISKSTTGWKAKARNK